MPRLPLILVIVALAGAVISGALFFQISDSKRMLERQLSDSASRNRQLSGDLATAHELTGKLKANLATAETALAGARDQLSSAELRATVLAHDLAQAKGVLSVYEQTARALGEEVASLKADLADTRATFASPEAVAAYKNTIAELERQLANARNGAAATTAAGASTAVFASRPGRATVLTVGPQGAFVVLNFGSNRGARVGQRLEVSQGHSVVATVAISDVRTNFSVAQVEPESVRGVLQKGDLALLIR